MRKILLTFDIATIKETLSIDNIYETTAYDGSPSLRNFVPTGWWWILTQDDEPAGIINCRLLNNVLATAHIIIRKQFRGNGSEIWGKQFINALKENTGVKKLLVMTPYENAKRYAERVGFEYITMLEKSILKNNELLDQYMLEISL